MKRKGCKSLTVVGIRRHLNLPAFGEGRGVLCIASAMPSTAYDRQPLKGSGTLQICHEWRLL